MIILFHVMTSVCITSEYHTHARARAHTHARTHAHTRMHTHTHTYLL